MSSSYPAASGGGGGGSGITALTGDVTAGPGSGSQAATVAGAHFGGTDGQFFKRATGVWAPASLALTDLPAGGATSNQLLAWNGTNWVPADLPAGYITAAMLHAGAAATNLGAFSGDVSGTPPAATVTGVQGRAVAATAPTTNQFYRWNGTTWVPSDLPAGYVTASMLAAGAAASNLGAFSGDVSGTPPAATVTGIQGQPVSGTASTTGQVMQWGGANWAAALIARLTGSDGYWETSTGEHLRVHSTATAPTPSSQHASVTSTALATGSVDSFGVFTITNSGTAFPQNTVLARLTFGTVFANAPLVYTFWISGGGYGSGAATGSTVACPNGITTAKFDLVLMGPPSSTATTGAIGYIVLGYV